MTPDDEHAYTREPDLLTPHYREAHISVAFTWDVDRVPALVAAWERKADLVTIGGPAIDGESVEPFVGGMYLKKGITITSRGCPRNCSFCMVRKGSLIEHATFPVGNIVQDNNILACSRPHWNRVVRMLRTQKLIEFRGGLDKYALKDWHVEDFKSLHIGSLFIACDSPNDLMPCVKAIERLKAAGFKRKKIRCYVLIGKDMDEERNRMIEIYKAGALPFAQLFRDPENTITYTKEWRAFHKEWCRPAATYTIMKAYSNQQPKEQRNAEENHPAF